jgi:hypothetical protein
MGNISQLTAHVERMARDNKADNAAKFDRHASMMEENSVLKADGSLIDRGWEPFPKVERDSQKLEAVVLLSPLGTRGNQAAASSDAESRTGTVS